MVGGERGGGASEGCRAAGGMLRRFGVVDVVSLLR